MEAVAVKYDADAKHVADAEFMEWIAELETVIAEFAAKHCEGENPYGGPLIESTGLDCWHDYFRDEYSPRDAFNEDRSYWE